MKTHRIVLASLLLLAGAAQAAPLDPYASGVLVYKEKLKIGSGCESFATVETLELTLYNDGEVWSVDAPAGSFSGTTEPTGKPGVWNLRFYASSLAAYEAYLEEVAASLCGTAVSITAPQPATFQLKFKNGSASFQMRESATGSSAFGSATGTHQLKGKGGLTLHVP